MKFSQASKGVGLGVLRGKDIIAPPERPHAVLILVHAKTLQQSLLYLQKVMGERVVVTVILSIVCKKISHLSKIIGSVSENVIPDFDNEKKM